MAVYTREQWAKDGTFKAEPMQEIEEAIYDEMFNVMPIQRLKEWYGCTSGFRTTEPYTHINGIAVYMAFGHKKGKYYYLGLQ